MESATITTSGVGVRKMIAYLNLLKELDLSIRLKSRNWSDRRAVDRAIDEAGLLVVKRVFPLGREQGIVTARIAKMQVLFDVGAYSASLFWWRMYMRAKALSQGKGITAIRRATSKAGLCRRAGDLDRALLDRWEKHQRGKLKVSATVSRRIRDAVLHDFS
jgi:hypothetical protein